MLSYSLLLILFYIIFQEFCQQLYEKIQRLSMKALTKKYAKILKKILTFGIESRF